jgi:hypothetical protein
MSHHDLRVFDHVLVIMFENQYRSYVMENTYMRNLAARGIDMVNYFGCMHPSQTNYIASLAGELCNVTDDDPPPSLLKQRNMVDLIEESPYDLSWKAYMDGYIPGNTPWTPELVPKNQFPYVIKHDPFSSFENIVRNEERWKRIQTEADFWSDLLNGTFPNYAWFTPDMWNDGHYLRGTQKAPAERAPALVDQLALWLEGFFNKLRFPGPDSHLPPNTLVVVTFDEADFESKYDAGKKYTYDGPNQIYTVLLGDHLEPGEQEEGYNHYSLIRTIEKNFGLADLAKNDREANWFRFLWEESFVWHPPEVTPLEEVEGLAATAFAGALNTIVSDNMGNLSLSLFDQDTWFEPSPLPFKGFQPVAQTAGNALHLFYKHEAGHLETRQYSLQTGWSDPVVLFDHTVGAYAAVDTSLEQLMLVYADAVGCLYSANFTGGSWSASEKVGFETADRLSLARLGATLLLIFPDKANGGQLSAVSYNTADFNVVTYPEGHKYSGPYDDTCKNAWGKNAYPVAHFAHGPNPVTPGEAEPLLQPYQAGSLLATATLDGVVHLLHPASQNDQVLSETYSISGIMTPKLPISYQASDQTTTSNGYGTLAEAGWSKQQAITGVNASKILVAATFEEMVVVFHAVGDEVRMSIGEYGVFF